MHRIFLCLAGLLLISSVARAERTINLGATEFPPYYSENLPNGGPLTKIVTAVYGLMGYRVIIGFYPWARALQMGKTGAVDGLLGVWHTPEREKWFLFSSPLPGNAVVIYKRKETPIKAFTAFNALKAYRVGIVRGYALPPGFNEAGLQTEEVTTDIQNLMMLKEKRVDLILIDKGVAKYLLRTCFRDSSGIFEMLQPPLEYEPLYLVISRKTTDAAQKIKDFNTGFLALEKEGKINAIRENGAALSLFPHSLD